MKGRNPIPAKLKLLHGNPGKRDIPEEPQPPSGRPPMPDDLDEHAQIAWQQVATLLDEMGVLTVAEGPVLEMYARAASGYRQALDSVNRSGIVLIQPGKDGTEVKRNPFSVELHKYREVMIKLLVEMGLTPVARARLGLANQQSKTSIFREFLA